MATLRVFKCTIPSVNFIFANGKAAIFQYGVYRTNMEWEISELEKEIAAGHPHIYIDAAEREIDSEMVDPMNALRAKIIAEYVAAQEAAIDPSNDMGTTEQQSVKPANSMDIAAGAAGGDGNSTSARLVKLAASKATAPGKE